MGIQRVGERDSAGNESGAFDELASIVRNEEIYARKLRKKIGIFIALKNSTNFSHVPSRRPQLCPRQLFELSRRFRFVAFELMRL